MVRKKEQLRMKELLSEAITVLCKASLSYREEFNIEGLIGITLDNEEIFLVNLNERVAKEKNEKSSQLAIPSRGEILPKVEQRSPTPHKHESSHQKSPTTNDCENGSSNKRSSASPLTGAARRKQSKFLSGPKMIRADVINDDTSSNHSSTGEPYWYLKPTSPYSSEGDTLPNMAPHMNNEDGSMGMSGEGNPLLSGEMMEEQEMYADLGDCDREKNEVGSVVEEPHHRNSNHTSTHTNSALFPEISERLQQPSMDHVTVMPRPGCSSWHVPESATPPIQASDKGNADSKTLLNNSTGITREKYRFTNDADEEVDVEEVDEENPWDMDSSDTSQSAMFSQTLNDGHLSKLPANASVDQFVLDLSQPPTKNEILPEMGGEFIPRVIDVTSGDTTLWPSNVAGERCHICGKFFAERKFLLRHINTHSAERRFKCNVCGKAFIQKGHMQQHMISHTGDKPFQCPVCARTYTRMHSVRLHLHQTHQLDPSAFENSQLKTHYRQQQQQEQEQQQEQQQPSTDD